LKFIAHNFVSLTDELLTLKINRRIFLFSYGSGGDTYGKPNPLNISSWKRGFITRFRDKLPQIGVHLDC